MGPGVRKCDYIPWRAGTLDRLRKLTLEGYSDKAMAAEFPGRTIYGIRYQRRKLGLKSYSRAVSGPAKTVTPELIEAVRAAFLSGRSNRVNAALLHLTIGQYSHILYRYIKRTKRYG